jgi:tRNA-2-methylthio-N6-dimethylallyladenosine synthase
MKFYIETYGCQMNVSDSELVASILTKAGFIQAEFIDDADVILFNTCSVRQHAEDRVIGRISNEQSRKLTKAGLKIGVIGCMAQRLGEKLIEMKTGIDIVAGVDQYEHLPELIMGEQFGSSVLTNLDDLEIYESIYPIRKQGLCGFVTIMRGCNNFCSYCIVPYVRGRERSRPIDDIIKEVDEAAQSGFRDITLLGQNVNSYNYKGTDFSTLMAEISKLDSIWRLRFVTSHPKDLSDSLIQIMADTKKICNHIHLPMQSGDDDILLRMNRKYTSSHYLGLIHKLRDAIPGIGITTDVIAGFPGEREVQFMNTYRMMEEIGFDYAFTFKYSQREGTAAAKYEDHLPEKVRLERLQKLINLQHGITLTRFREQIGKIKDIYIENVSKKSEKDISGKTEDFKITVVRNGDKSMIGTIIPVEIEEATGGTLIGKLAE